MKKIFVFSDTHKNIQLIRQCESIIKECDLVIHLGDYLSDVQYLQQLLGDKLICVKGNGDFLHNYSDEKELDIDGVKIFITHGHRYNVKATLENIGNEALKRECKAVLYGHTHRFDITDYAGVKLINPGSFFASKTGVYSYCYLIIWQGKIIPKIVEL